MVDLLSSRLLHLLDVLLNREAIEKLPCEDVPTPPEPGVPKFGRQGVQFPAVVRALDQVLGLLLVRPCPKLLALDPIGLERVNRPEHVIPRERLYKAGMLCGFFGRRLVVDKDALHERMAHPARVEGQDLARPKAGDG